jgi:hypothetical protein
MQDSLPLTMTVDMPFHDVPISFSRKATEPMPVPDRLHLCVDFMLPLFIVTVIGVPSRLDGDTEPGNVGGEVIDFRSELVKRVGGRGVMGRPVRLRDRHGVGVVLGICVRGIVSDYSLCSLPFQ